MIFDQLSRDELELRNTAGCYHSQIFIYSSAARLLLGMIQSVIINDFIFFSLKTTESVVYLSPDPSESSGLCPRPSDHVTDYKFLTLVRVFFM